MLLLTANGPWIRSLSCFCLLMIFLFKPKHLTILLCLWVGKKGRKEGRKEGRMHNMCGTRCGNLMWLDFEYKPLAVLPATVTLTKHCMLVSNFFNWGIKLVLLHEFLHKFRIFNLWENLWCFNCKLILLT